MAASKSKRKQFCVCVNNVEWILTSVIVEAINPQIYIYDCSINKYNLDRNSPSWSQPCRTQTFLALELDSSMVCLDWHRDSSWSCHTHSDIISWQSTYEVPIYRLLEIYIPPYVLDTLVTQQGASLLSCRKHVRSWLHYPLNNKINTTKTYIKHNHDFTFIIILRDF